MNLWESLQPRVPTSFRSSEEVHPRLVAQARDRFGESAALEIGSSEKGRPIYGFLLGTGPANVSLIAGSHADEPVGPETLRCLIDFLLSENETSEYLLTAFRFAVVPHVNPDGEVRNRPWLAAWPSLDAYLSHVQRDSPGRDIEFGYPDLRPENEAVAAFLSAHGPFRLHMSLHGLAFGQGALLLIDRLHAPHSTDLRDAFVRTASALGLGLHDENRHGEKGFFYIAPGFWTTPEGAAMRAHFQLVDDEEKAQLFRDSSMEFVSSLGGRPLSIVTEIPLYLIPHTGVNDAVQIARSVRNKLSAGRLQTSAAVNHLEGLGVKHVEIEIAIQMHAAVIAQGLRQAARSTVAIE